MKRWLAFLETKEQDDLLVKWGGEWDFLGDWLWPGESGNVNGTRPETQFFNNCYWVYALQTTAKIAAILGDEADSKAYAVRADQVRVALRKKFYRPATTDYATGDQQYLAVALLANVPTDSERPKVAARLQDEILVHRGGHIYAGITGGALLFRELLDDGRADLIYPMVEKEDFPGWGHFLKQGHTTFPEEWSGGGSQLHSSYLFVGAWFIEGLVGITQQPGAAGYQRFVLRPLVSATPELQHVSGSYDTLYGTIRCAWRREGDHLFLNATVPPNSRATLYLPTADPNSITESGAPLSHAKGVKRLKPAPNKAVLDLQPGTYEFETNWKG
jgi:alpha-L-rhamnosidase